MDGHRHQQQQIDKAIETDKEIIKKCKREKGIQYETLDGKDNIKEPQKRTKTIDQKIRIYIKLEKKRW